MNFGIIHEAAEHTVFPSSPRERDITKRERGRVFSRPLPGSFLVKVDLARALMGPFRHLAREGRVMDPL